ncbi:alkaline serine protease Alp1 [Boeremia exigua]|uniref:alkaline serine protease Alp1 n=1 Tax=Boeremia exigua TaxID=749465 RepID=UPI001E8D1E13|nr:alkaline serine protease Alp1 [Boeremia exigua]KAH6619980.1 alkaline serine protease Alp1 [Boeremia exigua]
MLPLLPVLALAASVYASPITSRDDRPKIIPGRYLVQLQTGANAATVASHHASARRLARRNDLHEPIERTFSIGGLNAYLGDFDEQAAADILSLDEVVSVVPDEYIYLEKTDFPPVQPQRRALTTQSPSIWSLGDLSHKAAGSTQYVYDSSAGAGMTAYVFDTGIRLTHQEFEGRARFGINGVTNSTDPSNASKDTDGHGTHCAGTVAGKTYGAAKKASLVDVKVFDGASGSISATLTGIQWAVNDVVSRGAQRTSVFSMSLGAETTATLLDDAVKAAYDVGILSIVAAGNADAPVGNNSPARLAQSFTVAMSRPDRGRVSLIANVFGSNYGPEVDVFAPGSDIVSASHLSDTGTSSKTGTSMATPLVAGLVCYLRKLEGGLNTPTQVTNRILQLGLKGVVSDTKGSPNVLVNNGSGA